jgi:hypothetical protein
MLSHPAIRLVKASRAGGTDNAKDDWPSSEEERAHHFREIRRSLCAARLSDPDRPYVLGSAIHHPSLDFSRGVGVRVIAPIRVAIVEHVSNTVEDLILGTPRAVS